MLFPVVPGSRVAVMWLSLLDISLLYVGDGRPRYCKIAAHRKIVLRTSFLPCVVCGQMLRHDVEGRFVPSLIGEGRGRGGEGERSKAFINSCSTEWRRDVRDWVAVLACGRLSLPAFSIILLRRAGLTIGDVFAVASCQPAVVHAESKAGRPTLDAPAGGLLSPASVKSTPYCPV